MANAQEIHGLIKTDNWERLKTLLDEGLAVDALFSIDNEYAPCTPLQEASGLGALRVIEGLVSRGANLEHGKIYGTPLDCAVSFDKLEAAKLLLEKGANPNSRGSSEIEGDGKWTPLLRAVYRKNLDMVELLLNFGGDVRSTSRRGIGVITCAAYNQDSELVRRFTTAGAPVSGNALLCAVERENEKLVQIFLSAGCGPNYVAGKVELSNADPGETPHPFGFVCGGGEQRVAVR